MKTIDSIKKQVQQTADDVTQRVISRDAERQLLSGHRELVEALKVQQRELGQLRREVGRRSSGGFPWGLVLLAGAGYALYRSNPSIRDRVNDLLGTVDPGVKGNLHRAADAAKDAVRDATRGDSPTDAVQRAAGEVQRAGEKAADHAADTWRDVKDGARKAADDLGSSTRKGVA